MPIKKSPIISDWGFFEFGGDGEIRTLEGLLTLVGFQDRCIQPLCHVSIGASLYRYHFIMQAPNLKKFN